MSEPNEAGAAAEEAEAGCMSATDWLRQAIAAVSAGRLHEAANALDCAAVADPRSSQVHALQGAIMAEIGWLRRAALSYRRAVECDGRQASAHFGEGVVLSRLGCKQEAVAAFDRALALGLRNAQFFNARGCALLAMQRLDEAIGSFDDALALEPNLADALANRACALKSWQLMRHDEAIRNASEAIELEPSCATHWYNRGLIHYEMGRNGAAQADLERAIGLDPDYVLPRVTLAHCLIQTGELRRGWESWEWRLRANQEQYCTVPCGRPRWRGEPLGGRTLLVTHEQGLGDAIHFWRYASVAAARGARVILETPPELVRLARSVEGVGRVIEYASQPPSFDLHCTLLSLPHLLGLGDDIPGARGYVCADAVKAAAWRRKLGTAKGLRVGLAWSGNPEHANDAIRTIAFSKFRELFVDGVEYVSLQSGARESDKAALERCGRVRHFGDELRDFSDTAALCAAMDVVISVDTSVAHLAGALGKPVWIMLPLSADWRWMLERRDTPWYANARLFRQQALGEWGPVLDEVRWETVRLARASFPTIEDGRAVSSVG